MKMLVLSLAIAMLGATAFADSADSVSIQTATGQTVQVTMQAIQQAIQSHARERLKGDQNVTMNADGSVNFAYPTALYAGSVRPVVIKNLGSNYLDSDWQLANSFCVFAGYKKATALTNEGEKYENGTYFVQDKSAPDGLRMEKGIYDFPIAEVTCK
jgi:hypothetical protein